MLNEKGIQTSGFCLGGGTKALLLLSHCKSRYSSSASEFFPVLPSARTFSFLEELQKKMGVGVENLRERSLKAFGETFQRTSFSAPAKKKRGVLLTDQKSLLENAFRKSSGLELEILEKPILSSENLQKIGFFTDLLERR